MREPAATLHPGTPAAAAAPARRTALLPGTGTLTHAEAVARLVSGAEASVVITGRRSTHLAEALTVSALQDLDPSWVLQTPPEGLEVGRTGSGDLLIAAMPLPGPRERVECAPTVLVVTGLGDHPDEYDLAADLAVLLPLAHRCGSVVLPDWDAGTRALADRLTEDLRRTGQEQPKVVTVGGLHSDVRLARAARADDRTQVAVAADDTVHTFTLSTPGHRSALTAAMTFAAALVLGADAKTAAAGISRSHGAAGHLSVCTTDDGRAVPGLCVLSSLARHPDDVTGDLEDILVAVDGPVVAVADVAGYDPGQAQALGRALSVASHLALHGNAEDTALRRTVAEAALDAGLPKESLTLVEAGPCSPTLAQVLQGLGIGDSADAGPIAGESVLVFGQGAPQRGTDLVAALRALPRQEAAR
nr:hypothetical protein KPHV_86220 [Kitasatospora purpeofusca]